jgi:hypothetical protein
MASEIIERIFPVSGEARLHIGNIRGSVTVEPGADDQIQVTAVKSNRDDQRTNIEMNQAEDGSVRVETRYSDPAFSILNFSRPSDVQYQVRVPRHCALSISCVSSTARLQGTEGALTVNSVSGAIAMADLASAEMRVTQVSGEVSGERLSGALKLETVSGDVHLVDSNFTHLDCSSVSGRVTIHTGLQAGPYHFNSVSGDVRLVVPAETSATLRLSSLSGGIHTGLPSQSFRSERGSKIIRIGTGGADVFLSSVSGGLWVSPSGEVPQVEQISPAPPTPEPPAPPPSPPPPPAVAPLNRREILDRIERGELSVEEGLRLLQQ